jgi:hypothetical protein
MESLSIVIKINLIRIIQHRLTPYRKEKGIIKHISVNIKLLNKCLTQTW